MKREMMYVVRNGELEHIWQFRFTVNGFDTFLYVRGTQSEVMAYLDSEYPERCGLAHALSEEQVNMVGRLGCPVYIAPKL